MIDDVRRIALVSSGVGEGSENATRQPTRSHHADERTSMRSAGKYLGESFLIEGKSVSTIVRNG
jgi:hypothetical protein